MPKPSLRIVCVHGVNTSESTTEWQSEWSHAIEDGVHRWHPDRPVQVVYLGYNDLFKAHPLHALDYVEALARLLKSGISTAIGSEAKRARGFGGVTQTVRWTAGMVVQWVDNAALREEARARVAAAIRNHKPEIILAHSLGSLLCYDTFIQGAGRGLLQGKTFVSFGSQIGSPFIRDSFGGRLVSLEARSWYHLFNRHDLETFTWPIRLADPAFTQLDADFNVAGILDHDAICYLRHPSMIDAAWPEILGVKGATRQLGASRQGAARASGSRPPRKERRALLVGINDYPDPKDKLEGCINDVFLISSLLQECGYDAEDIRVVLDKRATAGGILDRLEWLLDDAREDDERFFFYSGHGAQLPSYAPLETVDHKDECLVPYDFDWSLDHAVTDNQFFDLYSQLSYDVRFVAMFDCCYSGGITRDGQSRVRGITPPDDIRHRELKWNHEHQMWVERSWTPTNRTLKAQHNGKAFLGDSGVANRLGRAALLRSLPNANYDVVRRKLHHWGPYMPLVLEACSEKELASEYRHGVTSYGAFTYSLAKAVRAQRKARTPLTFEALVRKVTRELEELGYDQTPAIAGPRVSQRARVPWLRKRAVNARNRS